MSTVDRISNGIMGRVYRGELSVTEATGELSRSALSIQDREVRQAVVNGVRAELEDAKSLRLKGPEYAQADTQFREWEETYSAALARVPLPRGMTREQARATVKSRMDEYAALLGRGDIRPDRVDAYMRSADQRMESWFKTTFPPRRTPKR